MLDEHIMNRISHHITTYLSHLQNLTLILSKVGGDKVRDLFKFNSRKFMKNIEHLDLVLDSRNYFTHSGKELTFKFTDHPAIPLSKKLTLYHLELHSVPGFMGFLFGFEWINRDILQHLINLKTLDIQIKGLPTSTPSIKVLIDFLSNHLCNLEQISLSLEESNIVLLNTLDHLTIPETNKLKKFHFLMKKYGFFTPEAIKNFCTNFLCNLTNLHELKLEFIGPTLTDDVLQALSNSIMTNLHQLKVLELHFETLKEFPSLEVIRQSMNQHKILSLENITLNFCCCQGVTVEEIESLKHCIGESFPQLKSVKVLFTDSHTDSSYNPQDDEAEGDWSDSSEDYVDLDDEEYNYNCDEDEASEDEEEFEEEEENLQENMVSET